jgi:sphinganine-1-phosphate aldolase
MQLTTLSNKVLESRHLAIAKNIVFLLVLYHYWGRLYAKVFVGGPVRALYDFKDYLKKVTLSKKKTFTYTHTHSSMVDIGYL